MALNRFCWQILLALVDIINIRISLSELLLFSQLSEDSRLCNRQQYELSRPGRCNIDTKLPTVITQHRSCSSVFILHYNLTSSSCPEKRKITINSWQFKEGTWSSLILLVYSNHSCMRRTGGRTCNYPPSAEDLMG